MKSKKQTEKQLLIVDDQSHDIICLYNLAAQLGYQVKLAFDGEQALTETAKKEYDLIVLDWNMPFMNGKDFLSSISLRNSQTIQNIIIHTGEDLSKESIFSNDNYRVIDVWQKPISAVNMLRNLKKIDERRAA